MSRDGAEGNAPLIGDVMEQLALVLRQVFGIRLEQGLPQPSVQVVELFGPEDAAVILESRQQPADPEKERSIMANSEYLGNMLETSLDRLERLVTSDAES